MNKLLVFFFSSILFLGCGHAFENRSKPFDAIDDYKKALPLNDAYQKLTDNKGNGFEPLYGTRNFRVLLHGVAYRGGANNMFHRDSKRDNMNPLPADGLENLCELGFSGAVYLYRDNYSSAAPETNCQFQKAKNTLRYVQLSPHVQDEAYETLAEIHAVIQGQRSGPVYLHCWNGWHFSGLISAFALRQFCGVSAEDAVRYWDTNTDGNNRESKYESIRKRIRDFKPYPEFLVPAAVQSRICPSL